MNKNDAAPAPNTDNEVVAEIKVSLTREGNVLVTGPLHDKLFCFGLLEGAKQIVAGHVNDPAPVKSSLVSPHTGSRLPLVETQPA